MAKLRYELVLENHTLSDYDVNTVKQAFAAKSPKDAIYKADHLLRLDKSGKINLTYYGKQFLNGLAIAAETDLHVED